MILYYHPRFRRNYKKLDPQIQAAANKQVSVFRVNPFDVRLDTHRLHGKLKGQWSFSVDKRYRIVFEFWDKKRDEVVLIDIGNHNLFS
jgi:addiction module RelE/StbE family toxin